jgi:hypothetical protein
MYISLALKLYRWLCNKACSARFIGLPIRFDVRHRLCYDGSACTFRVLDDFTGATVRKEVPLTPS